MLEKVECTICKQKIARGNLSAHHKAKICKMKGEIYELNKRLAEKLTI